MSFSFLKNFLSIYIFLLYIEYNPLLSKTSILNIAIYYIIIKKFINYIL